MSGRITRSKSGSLSGSKRSAEEAELKQHNKEKKKTAVSKSKSSPAAKKTGKKSSAPAPADASLNPVHRLLQGVLVHEVLPDFFREKFVTIPSTASVDEAYLILKSNHVHSAPVIDQSTGEYVNVFDILDILELIVGLLSKVPAKSLSDEDNVSLNEAEIIISGMKATQVCNISMNNKLESVASGATLLEAAKKLCAVGVHRLVVDVFDVEGGQAKSKEGEIEADGILSQLGLLRWLNEKSQDGTFDALLDQPLSALPLSRPHLAHPVTVNFNQPCLQAFRIMHQKQVSGLGVVDDDGKLIGSISASDIQIWTEMGSFGEGEGELERMTFLDFSQLGRTIANVWAERSKSPVDPSKTPRSRVYSVKESHTLREVLNLVCTKSIHRVFVVDDATGQVPLRVFSLVDLLRALLDFHPNEGSSSNGSGSDE